MTWQEQLERMAAGLGLTKTSGYRTPGQERALGGPASSYHSRGTPEAPGAIDVGGSAERLGKLFDEIKRAFKGRIEELYLNIPGGRSVAIKDNRYLSSNPEAGRRQHLHVAIGGALASPDVVQPASRIVAGDRGSAGLEAAPADVCVRTLCPPDFKGMIQGALGEEVQAQSNCLCWSDIWLYGASLSLIISGAWLVFKGKE